MDRIERPRLSPLQAHEAIEHFEAQRGGAALRLAMHAALPQSLRVDLLHALRLNFAAETLGDAAVEADVLFAPFVLTLGNACWEFDGEVRMQLLRALDPCYPGEAPPRSVQVADFVLAWLDRERRRMRASSDIVYCTWIDVERWNALAFADPDAAAERLAEAVQQAMGAVQPTVRLRIGTLAAALATPLVAHRRLLAFARGVEALHVGEIESAQQLLERVGDHSIVAGTRSIDPGAAMRAARARSSDATEIAASSVAAPAAHRVMVIVHAMVDEAWSHRLRPQIEQLSEQDNSEVRQVDELTIGQLAPGAQIDWLFADAQVVVVLLSPNYVESSTLARVDERLLSLQRRGAVRLLWTCVRRCLWQRTPYAGLQWVHSANEPLADMTEVDAERHLEQIALAVTRAWTAQPVQAAELEPAETDGSIYITSLAEEAGTHRELLVERLRKQGLAVYEDSDSPAHAQPSSDAATPKFAAMLILIGPRWAEVASDALGSQQHEWAPRFARVADALSRGTTVVPVLIDDTSMPRWPELPGPLKALLSLRALPLRLPRWDEDLQLILSRVNAALGGSATARAVPPRRVLLVVEGRNDRGLADALAAQLRSIGYESVTPGTEFDTARPRAILVSALRGADFLVLDLSLPEGRLIDWTSAAAEARVPLVPIQGAENPARDAWAAHLLEPRRAAWVAPAVHFDRSGELEHGVASRIVHAAAAVQEREKPAYARDQMQEEPAVGASLHVALCSTMADLSAFRDAAVAAATGGGHEVTPFDYAEDSAPLQRELASIAQCEVAVFIVAWRYGYLPIDPELNPHRLSIVELQYREALRLETARLVLLVEDVPDWPTQWIDGDDRITRFRSVLARDSATRPIRSVEDLRTALDGFLAEPKFLPGPGIPVASPGNLANAAKDHSEYPPGRVLLFVGHSIDRTDRAVPRFPAALEAAAASAIREAVAAELERGNVAYAIACATDGGDLLFLEACANLGVPTRIFLPVPDRKFVEIYLGPMNADWIARYRRVAQRSPVIVLPDPSSNDTGAPLRDLWQRNSDAMLEAALARGAEQAALIALWDGEPTESPGGPTYLLSRANTLGIRRVVINPKALTVQPSPLGARRPLHLFFLVDTSASMNGKKIDALNEAMRGSIATMREVAEENPNAEVFVRVLRFGDVAQWHVSQPTSIHDFRWTDLHAAGATQTGAAIRLLTEALKVQNMPVRGLPPVAVLITDGGPTDDYDTAIQSLLTEPWGKRALRIGLAIGDDADLISIERFISNPDLKPVRTDNLQDLAGKIKWASTVPLRAVARTDRGNIDNDDVAIPLAPPPTSASASGDVF